MTATQHPIKRCLHCGHIIERALYSRASYAQRKFCGAMCVTKHQGQRQRIIKHRERVWNIIVWTVVAVTGIADEFVDD